VAAALRAPGALPDKDMRDEEGRRAADPPKGARGDPPAADGLSTWREILPRLRTLPRGIPKPAESPRNGIRFCSTPPGEEIVLRFTIRVRPGVAGGLGKLNCRGGFVICGTVFHPDQEFPGSQNQP
jgi:hypothetical protein